MTKNSNKIRAIILLNPPYYTGVFKNEFTKELINRCRQDNYAVFKVLYSKGQYDYKTLRKLARVVSKQRQKITIIIAKDSNTPNSNILAYSVFSTLTIMRRIDLCFYEQYIALNKYNR